MADARCVENDPSGGKSYPAWRKDKGAHIPFCILQAISVRPRTTKEGQTLDPLSNVEHIKNWIFNGVSAYCEVLAQRRMIQPSKVTTNCQRANRHDTRYDKQYNSRCSQWFKCMFESNSIFGDSCLLILVY